MLDNGNFGFLYSFLPGATISTPVISTPAFLILPRFQSPLNSSHYKKNKIYNKTISIFHLSVYCDPKHSPRVICTAIKSCFSKRIWFL